MPQFRLTQKFAKDLKVVALLEPTNPLPILDDWLIDVIRIDRKKVAMVTHMDSRLTFFLPYANIGGAVGVIACTGVLLDKFLIENDLQEQAKAAEKLFQKPPVFCSTQNRPVLGHMIELKRYISMATHDVRFVDIDWEELIERINGLLLRMPNGEYARPAESFIEKFSTAP